MLSELLHVGSLSVPETTYLRVSLKNGAPGSSSTVRDDHAGSNISYVLRPSRMPEQLPVIAPSVSPIFGSNPYSKVQVGASTTPSRVMNSCTRIAPMRRDRTGRRDRRHRRGDPGTPRRPLTRILRDMIERAPFGATGHESSRVIFGAAALGDVSKADADRTLEVILEHGINHIDVAFSYGDAELRISNWVKEHEFFLATKTGERTYAGAREQIRRSLDRLGVDHVDSIQLHNLVDVIEWDIALSPGGALEACIEARDEGLVRFIGVTGHGLSLPKMHQRSLDRFAFDSVLCPYNWVQMQDPRYAETFDGLAAMCAERNVALQTIKSLAYKPWEGREQTASTWYEPLTDQGDIDLAVSWVLANPQVFLLTTGDVDVLPKLLDAAERAGERPSDDQMAGLKLAPLFT